MKKLPGLVLFVSLAICSVILISCSKKDSTDTTKKQENSQNTNKQTDKSMKEMIDFSWNENGRNVKLSDFKGKVIVLNFWATWCGPCRKELPSLSQLSTDLKDKNFKMIGISVDNEQVTIDNFLKSNTLSYTVLHEPNGLLAKYMSASGVTDDVIPQTFIIDKNGKIVESLIGSRSKEDFMTIINKYL